MGHFKDVRKHLEFQQGKDVLMPESERENDFQLVSTQLEKEKELTAF